MVTVPAPLGVLAHDPASERRYSPLPEPKQYLALMCRPRLPVPFPKTADDDRANFALNQMRDFRAPDWPCGLRENLPIDPLCWPGNFWAGSELALIKRQVGYTVEEEQALNRVLPKGRGVRGKRTIA